MRNVFIFFAFLIAGMAQAQIITNVDKLRIRDIEQGVENDKILVIDSDNVVRWIDAIEVDLSDYYTISEVDTFVADLEAGLLERYTKDEVDALLDGLELRLDDYYTKTEADSIITNVNDRIDSLELEVEQIDLNTVTSVDNVTSIKIRGSDIFTNNLESDFAQIADVNKAGFGLISMQSEMKIGLVAKDGTTLLDDVDVSWLASGDLAITIDDTDPINPELVFSQGGVEVARIPASTLLSGVARSANLSNYILQFKDGTGAVVYSVNLEPLFEDYFTKAEADARYARGNRTISAGNGLTGGGNLTANRTIGLSTDTQNDIAKGVEAHGWGDFRDYGLGVISGLTPMSQSNQHNSLANSWFRVSSAGSSDFLSAGIGISLSYSQDYSNQLFIAHGGNRKGIWYRSKVLGESEFETPIRVWDDGNLPNPATESWVNDQGFVKSNALNNYYTKTEGDARFALRTRTITGTGGLTGGGNLTANRTIDLSSTTKSDIAKGVTAHGWGDFRDYGLGLLTTETILNQANQHSSLKNSWFRVSSSANSDFMAAGTGISLSYSEQINNQLFIAHSGNRKGIWYRSKATGEYEFETPIKVWDDLNLPNPATESWVNSQFIPKSGNATKSGTLTFEASPKVPMGTQPDDAINLAQLTASNPIALNKVVNSKSFLVPSSVSNFALDMEGGRTFIVPSGLLDVDGAVVKVTFTVSGLAPLDSSDKYRSLISTTNTGFAPGSFGYSVGPNNAVANVEFTIRRVSASNILVDTHIDEKHFPISGTSTMEAVVHNYLGYNQGFNIGSPTNFGIDVYVRPNGLGNNLVKVSDILIQKIK